VKNKLPKARRQTKEQKQSVVVSLDSLRQMPTPLQFKKQEQRRAQTAESLLAQVEEVSLQNKKLLQELFDLGGEVADLRASFVKLLTLLKQQKG